MTPAARLAASIELLAQIMPLHRPADAVANNFFRERRYIGGGDRRVISARVWDILRNWRKLHWWLAQQGVEVPSARLLCGGWAVLGGQPLEHVMALFSGGKYAPELLDKKEAAVLTGLVGRSMDSSVLPRSVYLEIPEWVMPVFEARFGKELEKEAKALLAPAPLDLRVNTLKSNMEDVLIAFEKEKWDARKCTLSPWGIRIEGRVSVTTSSVFKSGDVEIQDEGSQLVSILADAQPGLRVMDYCAGAGGKTLGMAMAMHNKGHIVACDISSVRLDNAVKRLRRAGVHNVERHLLAEGDKWLKRQKSRFDRVLVDAPCTGTGTWRRNPDGRLSLTQNDIDELVEKQKNILLSAARLVKPGGKLVYATCSVLPQENEQQIQAFLQSAPDFFLVSLKEAAQAISLPERLSEKLPQKLLENPYLELTPAQYGTDGFFCAIMQKQKQDQDPAEKPKKTGQ